uniref:VP1 n=1 Tax=Fennes virus TaxID=2707218 RepID=A0A859D675_9VIRU|nr:VP1 [Fennes virus]
MRSYRESIRGCAVNDIIETEKKLKNLCLTPTTLEVGDGTLSRVFPDPFGHAVGYLFIQYFVWIRLVVSNELEISLADMKSTMVTHAFYRLLVSMISRTSGHVLWHVVSSIPEITPPPHPLDTILHTPTPIPISLTDLLRGQAVNLSYWEYDARLRAIRSLTKKNQYLPNFDVVELMKLTGKIGEDVSFNEAIVHGLQKCWHECYKPRSGSLNQNLVLTLIAYRCSECVQYLDVKYQKPDHSVRDAGHICLFTSGGVHVLKQMMGYVREFPFFYTLNGVVAHRDAPRLGAGVPLFWWQTCELMTHTSTGSITSRLEWLLLEFWVDRARDNMFGRTFDNRTPFEEFRGTVLDQSDLVMYHLRGVTPVGMGARWWLPPPLDLGFLDDVTIECPRVGAYLRDVLQACPLTDRVARWVAVMSRFFYGPMLYVTGATSLSLEQSAQVQAGQKPVMRKVLETVELGGSWVPIRHAYGNPQVQAIFEQALRRIHKVDFTSRNLESEFLEEQTTNSSGIVESMLTSLKEELTHLVSPENLHMITKVRQARIVDALITIQQRFNDFDSFVQGLGEVGKAGQRLQVNRRPRVIQMVRTCQQLGGFLIRSVLKAIYMDSPFASTGKNVGDLRDMEIALNISATAGLKSSNDVKGMDMSTKKPQVDFNFEISHAALSSAQNPGVRCFFNCVVDEQCQYPVVVEHEGTRLVTKFTVCQYVLALCRRAFEARTEFFDGFFQTSVETSARGFRSGWFATSDNHNEIGIEILEYIKANLHILKLEDLGVRPGQVFITGSVAGDDQVLGVRVGGVLDTKITSEVGRRVINLLVSLMNEFGYVCDPSISRHSAEFLKQLGVCGAPELFPSRLLLYTAERGDTSNVHLIGQMNVMLAMLREKVSRSPGSAGWVDYMIGAVLVLGSMTVYRSAGGAIARRRYLNVTGSKSEFGAKAAFPSSTGRWCRALTWGVSTRKGRGSTCFVAPFFLWYVNHVQGVPPPPFRSISGQRLPGGSQYTIPSVAIFWHILQAVRRRRDAGELVVAMDRALSVDGVVAEDIMDKILRHLGYEQWRRSDRSAMVRLLLSEASRVPVHLEWEFATDLLDELNVIGGMYLAEKMPLVKTERPAREEPIFRGWQETGNSLLDPRRTQRSRISAAQLRGRYGITVPEALVYYNRAGARIEQALQQVTTIAQERVDEDLDVLTLAARDISWTRSRNLFMMAWFDVVPTETHHPSHHPLVISEGWGVGVCPDSELSWLIGAFDFPDVCEDTYAHLSYRMSEELRLPGSVDVYVKYAKRALRARGEAFQLFLDSVGLSPRDGQRLYRYIVNRGQLYDEIPFAHNPRQTFYFGLSPSNIASRSLVIHDPRGVRTPNYVFSCLSFGAIACMRPGLIAPTFIQSGRGSSETIRHPQYSILLSPALTAHLAHIPRLAL